MESRIERDTLGERKVPTEAYYGVQTDRALENFPISGLRAKTVYVDATIHIKKAAAIVNKSLGQLDPKKADAIIRAADEMLGGRFREWFVVDVFQAGAGTSHNMNVNEVIANRAIELLGGQKGDYAVVHPNDDVNMSQSSNDVCPAAVRIAAVLNARKLILSLLSLEQAFARKSGQFDKVIKSGRTHLMDAVPLRLGQEFGAWATNMRKHSEAIGRSSEQCKELGLGGTAVGTGLNAHRDYRQKMVEQVSSQLDVDLRMSRDYFEAMQSLRPLVELSGAIRNLGQDLIRISNDIRLLASGPTTGLSEIAVPAVQPGSSAMPGKVNPVMMEMMDMVCFQVIGCDTVVLLAAQAGQLELNVMLPVVAYNILHEIEILGNAVDVYEKYGITGITANEERCRSFAQGSIGIVTVLIPYIGYAKAAEIAKESLSSGKSIRRVIVEKGLFPEDKLNDIFDLYRMTEPGAEE